MLKDLNFSLFDELNKVKIDKFGSVSAFLALNKPIGITSHDLVDQVRKKLKTKKVGHAGALDPFASGVMLILVGKKYTRLADDLINLSKAYKAGVLFGITTDTLDVEGKVIKTQSTENINFSDIKKAFKSFEGNYDQFVPVYSLVKVEGNKLRVLARQSESYEFFAKDGQKFIRFIMPNKNVELPLPYKNVKITDCNYIEDGFKEVIDLDFLKNEFNIENEELKGLNKLPYCDIEFGCSKGTYVRQFAYDLAQEIDQIAMLYKLTRTRVGDVTIADCMDIEDLKY